MSGLPQPTAWRLMLVAFALWAANFLLGYAAVLIAPDAMATRLLLGGLAILSLGALVVVDRRGRPMRERRMVRVASIVAALAIAFNGATALA